MRALPAWVALFALAITCVESAPQPAAAALKSGAKSGHPGGSSPLATIVYQVQTSRKILALTFDAGADRGYAAQILSILERNRIKATFGMTGLWAHANPDLIRRMARDHDTFINHTYDHHPFTPSCASGTSPVLTTRARTNEIKRAEAVIRSISHESAKPYFRPPCGGLDRSTLQLLRRLGYRYVIMWTVDSLGWNGLSAASIERRCLDLAAPGGIIAMHVGIQSLDAVALPEVIAGLRRRGYSFATVPRLLAYH
jgi:peptidoglycan-N-acetylglucosamine deacetylase